MDKVEKQQHRLQQLEADLRKLADDMDQPIEGGVIQRTLSRRAMNGLMEEMQGVKDQVSELVARVIHAEKAYGDAVKRTNAVEQKMIVMLAAQAGNGPTSGE